MAQTALCDVIETKCLKKAAAATASSACFLFEVCGKIDVTVTREKSFFLLNKNAYYAFMAADQHS